MLNAKRLMSVVLILAMLVTMASFPVSADTVNVVAPAKLTFAGGTMTGSNGSNKAANAVDGDYSTYYISDQYKDPQGDLTIDLIFELDTPGTLDSLKIQWGNKGWGNMGVNKYNVAVSEDNVTYTTIREYDGLYNKPTTYKDTYGDDITYSGTSGGGSFKAIVEAKGLNLENVKYIKIEIRNSRYRPTIAEIEAGVLREVTLTSYTVNYVDTEGNPIADAKVVDTNTFVGDDATETAPAIPGYEVIEATKTITLVDGENVITFEYEKLPDFNYTVKYVDEEGNPLVPETTGVAIYPYEVTIETPYVNGYYRPATITKTIAADGEVVEIVYEALPEKMMPTPDNLLKNATIKASSSYTTGGKVAQPPEYAKDGDSSTYWQSNNWTTAPNDTITINLGGKYDINDISIKWLGNETGGDLWVGGGAHRSAKYEVSVSSDGTNYTTVYTFDNKEKVGLTDRIEASDFSISPRDVQYVKIKNITNRRGGRAGIYELNVNGYAVTDRIASAPSYKYYAEGSTAVNFPITVMTLENVEPSFFANKANWTPENATIDGDIVINNVSVPDSNYYTWEFNVKVIPVENDKEFSLEIDLPDSYVLQDKLTLSRKAADFLFDAAVADGDNRIDVSKTDITINYESDGTTIKTKEKDRTVDVAVTVQHIIENNPAYKGFADLAIEVKDIIANGDRVTVDFKNDFIRVGDTYYGRFIFGDRLGMERFQATVVLYGVYPNGTKEELESRVIYSDAINISKPLGGISTEAQELKDKTVAIDVLDQLFDQVHPYDLPVYTESEWDLYREILEERGIGDDAAQAEIDRLRNKIAELQEAASDPNWVAPNYPDSVTIITGRWKWSNGARVGDDVNDTSHYERNFYVNADLWNLMKSLHVESFSIETKIENARSDMRPNESVVEKLYLTFRNGIDYDPKVNWISGTFNVRTQFIATTDAYSTKDETFLARGYNAFRRALNDDQVMPLMFRLGWYNWPSKSNPNPFSGGVYTAVIPETWLDNNGSYNLAVYRMSGYSYKKDNDPTLKLMADDLHVANHVKREVSFEVKGDDKLYETYVIVGTDKLPSELPETLAIYYDVE